MISVFIAEDEDIIREGLKALINSIDGVEVVGEAKTSEELSQNISVLLPDVLIIDYNADSFNLLDIRVVQSVSKPTKIVAITELSDKDTIQAALRLGINGHILKCCDRQEIHDSIFAAVEDNKFYCGKVLKLIEEEGDSSEKVSCLPVSLSNREIEIIAEIADGKTNKEIADSLCLSSHTVHTHRKNIMAKLGVNNTAGIVIFAVRENIISPNKYLFDSVNI